jgi:hypothetical protein
MAGTYKKFSLVNLGIFRRLSKYLFQRESVIIFLRDKL